MLCSFCRYLNDKTNKTCRHCKSSLIEFEGENHEEAYGFRENLRTSYLIRLKPRITNQEQLEKERETFYEEWKSMFGEIVRCLNRDYF